MSDTSAVPVATSNAAQLHAWDGSEGQYWAAHADYFDAGGRRLPPAAARAGRHRAETTRSSTSGAAPVRPPVTPRGPPPQAQLSESTCPRACSMSPARAPSEEGVAT